MRQRRVHPRLLVRAVAIAVTIVTMLALTGVPAWAHTELKSTTPAAGSVATGPITAVELVFSSVVKEQFSTVVVVDATGTSYGNGAPGVSGATVTQPTRPLPPGLITVTWRTVAEDGAPVQGTFTFQLAGGAVSTTAPTADSAGGAGGPAATTRESRGDGGSWWGWLTLAGVVLLLSAVLTLGWPWRRVLLARAGAVLSAGRPPRLPPT